MKQLFKLTGCLALAGLFASCQSVQQEANYQIIPMPQEIVTAQGKSLHPQEQCENSLSGRKREDATQRKIPGRLSENGYRKDFAIEAGTEGKTQSYWH